MSRVLITHPHVETYIEIIAGYLQPDGRPASVFDLGEPLINLARYDMKIVPSLANQTLNGTAYTDKQAKLAQELVLKYERQLTKHGISVDPVRNPQYRLPIRTINRARRVFIKDDYIILQFPFLVDLVDQVREYCKISKGRIEFDHANKYHKAELTEHNLNWIYTFASQNNFEIDRSIDRLMQILLEVETQGFEISLQRKYNGLNIINAADSMCEYIDNHIGGFASSNILRLVDHAPVLGYNIDETIEKEITQQHGQRFWKLCTNKILKIEPEHGFDLLTDVIRYANHTNRLPIYVYEPDLSFRLLKKIGDIVPAELIYRVDNDYVPLSDAQIIYLTRLPKLEIGRVPLLVSSAGMMFGVSKTSFLQSAEKVVYFSQDVYNKHIKGMDICKLD